MDFARIYRYCVRVYMFLDRQIAIKALFERVYSGPKDIDSIIAFLTKLDDRMTNVVETRANEYLMDAVKRPCSDEELLLLFLRVINAAYMFNALSLQVSRDGHGRVLCTCATLRECLLMGMTTFWTIRCDEFLRNVAECYCSIDELPLPLYAAP